MNMDCDVALLVDYDSLWSHKVILLDTHIKLMKMSYREV